MDKLDKMILRAIPVDIKCAITEHVNKVRRQWLKDQFNLYLEEQLSINARPVESENGNGLDKERNRSQPVL